MTSQQSSASAGATRVFIAEDSVNTQLVLTELIAALERGVVVATATSEAVAIDWAKRHPDGWDLAVVDLMLNEGDGFKIIKRLRELSDSGRIVVFSAFVTDVIRRHCRAIGADAVFQKTETSQLIEYLERLGDAAAA